MVPSKVDSLLLEVIVHYRNDIDIVLVRLTLLTSAAPDPFCHLLARELRALCIKLYIAVPVAPMTIRRTDEGLFLLPEALEMLNHLINETSRHFDHYILAYELRQIKGRVILKHTDTLKETREILAGIIASIPSTGILDE